MKPKILVLGASGFVGREVVRALCRGGHAVRGTFGSGEGESLLTGEFNGENGLDVEWVEVDLESSKSIEAVLQGCVAVIHAAGYEPAGSESVAEANRRGVAGLRRVLDGCLSQRVLRIVYVSSVSTIHSGDIERVYDETDFYTPGQFFDPYFEVKYRMEAELYRYFGKGLEIVVALPTLILGPGCVNSRAHAILGEVFRLTEIGGDKLANDGSARVNIVDVRDVASALVAALERGRAGRRYVLGGINTDLGRLRELLDQAIEAAGYPAESFMGGRVHGRYFEGLAERLTGLRGKQIVAPVTTYLSERLADNLGNWKVVGRGGDLQSEKARWYGMHVNSQRARGELGHRPRLLAQTIESSIDG